MQQPTQTYPTPQPVPSDPKSRRRAWPTIVLGLLALILAGTALVLYWQERNANDDPAVPTALPGRNELIQVEAAIRDQGLDAEIGRRTTLFPPLQVPGQELVLDDTSVWVFIYQNPELRQQAEEALGDTEIALTTPSGQQLTTTATRLTSASNVIVVVPTDSPAGEGLADEIQAALDTLP